MCFFLSATTAYTFTTSVDTFKVAGGACSRVLLAQARHTRQRPEEHSEKEVGSLSARSRVLQHGLGLAGRRYCWHVSWMQF